MEALLAGEQGVPTGYRSGEPLARITAFYDRLSKGASDAAAGDHVAEIRIVDIDTGAHIDVGVDLAAKRFVKL
jgi:hypothetical protein